MKVLRLGQHRQQINQSLVTRLYSWPISDRYEDHYLSTFPLFGKRLSCERILARLFCGELQIVHRASRRFGQNPPPIRRSANLLEASVGGEVDQDS